ncbi:MAG: penicillin-binding protein 1C [Verrucomicrobiaceae bacterium]|nr:penicillin-binding protein 1C [Verrucomicrobiaceae bacterium]
MRGKNLVCSRTFVRSCRLAFFISLIATASWLLCPQPALLPPSTAFSPALLDRDGHIVHLALTNDGKYRLKTPLADISPNLVSATLAMEDRHFHSHPGVNPVSLLRGAWGMISGTRQGGGSTITMQYARLRFGLRTKSITGKFVQIARALQLERYYSKDQILEAYLNLAPYGGNVEGVGAASLLWCGKEVKDLSMREAVALAVLPQSPTRRRPKIGGENEAHAAASYRLWQRIGEEDGMRIDPLDAGYTLRPEARVPREVPHLARRQFKESGGQTIVHSFIDLPKQQIVEDALGSYIGQRREVGIRNACAMLVHAPSREVLAYVGSVEFLESDIQGQVDGVMARRSPGSALKPFVYALAMQQGLIHPRTLLRDGRLSFGAYNPENFDREFTGPIPAAEALFRSRNIPAVALAQRLEAPGLYGFLKQGGVALPRPESHYGLALPLGGAEVSMEELASLYCLLADDGRPRPLRLTVQSPTVTDSAPLLTEAVRFLTRDMLRAPSGYESVNDPDVTWKTGTSQGFRDAWAAGIRGDYVLVVWIGNFNGKANPAFVARECAAPLLFEVFDRLRLPRRPMIAPTSVEEVKLCAVSGQLPTPHCQHCLTGWFIPGVSSIQPCEIHREVLLDDATGLRVARDDGTRKLRREVFEFWQPDLLEMFRQAGLPRREPPPFETTEGVLAAASSNEAPRIVSPRPALVYTLRATDRNRQKIPLRADTAAGVRTVYWFAGKQFIGAATPTDPLMWKPSTGSWRIQALDDHGRTASCTVRVEMVE